MYRGENDVCHDYARYRKLKNIVMWESADGAFQGYVSCDVPAATLRQAKAVAMTVAKQGRITRLTCGYGDGIAFTWRTRAECKVQTAGCTAAAPCEAQCD
jgi:predicted secreted protein